MKGFKTGVRRLVCAVCALSIALTAAVSAAAAGPGAALDATAQTLSAADAQQMQQADAALADLTSGEDYAAMPAAERAAAAAEQLEQLADQGLVRRGSIYTDEENGMVTYAYRCGALGGITFEDPDQTDAERFAVMPADSNVNGLLEFSGERYEFVGSAMIYYAFDDTGASNRYPYYAYMQSYWNTLGLTAQLDSSVTVSDLRHMDRYDICILSAHGSYFTYATDYFSNRLRTEPVILLLEESTMLKDLLYGFRLLDHSVIKVNGRYCVTPAFFRASYRSGALDSTIILSETCEFFGVSGSEDYSMADALLAGGAQAVLGFVNNVYTVYSRSVIWDVVNRMLEGQTLRQATDHALNLYGANDLIWYNSKGGKRPHRTAAYAQLRGSENVCLARAAARSASQAA